MKKIVIITGTELRHEFFRKSVAIKEGIDVLLTFCESQTNNLQTVVSAQENKSLREQHLSYRQQTEEDFFKAYCSDVQDKSNPVFIEKGQINSEECVSQIVALNPDLIISYGCSIIKAPLIEKFSGRFINLHLGLSPYYRGSGTNYWPFVNNELQYIGVSYMFIDVGVDTGEILHQIRPDIYLNDDVHTIGNRLIKKMSYVTQDIVLQFDSIVRMPQLSLNGRKERYYKNKDFTEESLHTLYGNFETGMLSDYLEKRSEYENEAPIICNTGLRTL